MPIRPIDMQVMLPKLQEVSQMRHAEQQRAGLAQDQSAQMTEKNITRNHQTVIKSNQDERAQNEADAREKGKNTYQSMKKRTKDEVEEEAKKKQKSSGAHKIDIQI